MIAIERAPLQYELWGGPAVPEALLQRGEPVEEPLRHLSGDMLPILTSHRDPWTWTLMESLTPGGRRRQTEWP